MSRIATPVQDSPVLGALPRVSIDSGRDSWDASAVLRSSKTKRRSLAERGLVSETTSMETKTTMTDTEMAKKPEKKLAMEMTKETPMKRWTELGVLLSIGRWAAMGWPRKTWSPVGKVVYYFYAVVVVIIQVVHVVFMLKNLGPKNAQSHGDIYLVFLVGSMLTSLQTLVLMLHSIFVLHRPNKTCFKITSELTSEGLHLTQDIGSSSEETASIADLMLLLERENIVAKWPRKRRLIRAVFTFNVSFAVIFCVFSTSFVFITHLTDIESIPKPFTSNKTLSLIIDVLRVIPFTIIVCNWFSVYFAIITLLIEAFEEVEKSSCRVKDMRMTFFVLSTNIPCTVFMWYNATSFYDRSVALAAFYSSALVAQVLVISFAAVLQRTATPRLKASVESKYIEWRLNEIKETSSSDALATMQDFGNLLTLINTNTFGINVGNLFTITPNTLLTIGSIVATYFVILLQFKFGSSPNDCKSVNITNTTHT